MKKKVVCLALSLLVILSAFPVNAFAAEVPAGEKVQVENISYAIDSISNREIKFINVETQDVNIYVSVYTRES